MIIRNHEDLKIRLPPYKITIKTTNKEGNSYQYSCILPPILCSFFNIQDNKSKDQEDDPSNLLMFYENDNVNYIMSGTTFYKALRDAEEHKILEDISNMWGYEPKPELVEYCNNNPVNFGVYDKIRYEHKYNATAYKMTNSNNYRVTLPNKLFKNKVNPLKNNYILFTIDTQKEDLLYNKGVITYVVNTV